MKSLLRTMLTGVACLAALEITAVAGSLPFQVLVTANGPGTVTPDVAGKAFASGKTCTLTAHPAPEALFAGWTGSFVSTNPVLRFTVRSNVTLQANFGLNPFFPAAGTYEGLFAPGTVAPDNSGWLSATATAKGGFSAKLRLAGRTYSFSGRFSSGGWAFGQAAISRSNHLTLALQLDLAAGQALVGTVGNELWTANLLAYRAGAYPQTNAARYTMLFPGLGLPGSRPAGDGYGALAVANTGSGTLSATLADGTTLTCSSGVSSQGLWPLYAAPYGGKGIVFGWLAIADSPDSAESDLTGQVSWIKPKQTTTKYYAGGFTNLASILGSRYVYTKRAPVLNPGIGSLRFGEGNLPAAFTNQVVLRTNSTILTTNRTLKLTLTTTSGLFQGSVANPFPYRPLRTLSFKGAVFQKQNFGAGFFLGTNQSGQVVWGDYPGRPLPVVVSKGPTTTVTNLALDGAGGVISLAGGPLAGVTIRFPRGALSTTTAVRLWHNQAALTLPPGSAPGQVFDLQAEKTTTFTEPVIITIPFENVGAVVPVPYAVDVYGLLHPCQVTAVDQVNGSLTFETFRPGLFAWLLARLPESTRANAPAQATGFNPAIDGFQITNSGTLYNPGGECLGFTAFEQWFYREQQGGLYARFQQEFVTGAGDRTVPGQSVLATRAFNAVARIWTSYEPRVQAGYNLSPLQRFLSVVNILDATRAPAILYLRGASAPHSLLAYDYWLDAHGGGALLVGDPNAPGASQWLAYDPAQPEAFHYGPYTQVGVVGEGSFGLDAFDELAADAERGFNGSGAAQVRVTSHTDGQQVSGRTITLAGQVVGGLVPVSQLGIVLNGCSVIDTPVDTAGSFRVKLSLNAGTNALGFITRGLAANQLRPGLNTQRQPFQLVANLDGAILLATLTWNTPTDLDLYVLDPAGDYSAYYHRRTADGAALDYDNTAGYGPEHWTLNWDDAIRWNQPYKFRVHYYYGSAPVTQWTLTLWLYEATSQMIIDSFSGVLSGPDGSINDAPNGSGPSWADACTLVPVPASFGFRPLARKRATGEVELAVPVPALAERLVHKAWPDQAPPRAGN